MPKRYSTLCHMNKKKIIITRLSFYTLSMMNKGACCTEHSNNAGKKNPFPSSSQKSIPSQLVR